MPTFDFKGPDGKIHSVSGPEGATAEQAFQILQAQLGSATPAPTSRAKPAAASAQQSIAPAAKSASGSDGDGGFLDEAGTAVRGVGTGLGRTVLGAQRLLGKWYGFLGDKASGAPSPSLSDLVAGKKPQSTNLLARAGNWLVNDAETGRSRMAGELAPYKERNPLSALAGETVGEIAATAPIGAGAVGAGAKMLPARRLRKPVLYSGPARGQPRPPRLVLLLVAQLAQPTQKPKRWVVLPATLHNRRR